MPGPDPNENDSPQDVSGVNISGGENVIRGDVIGGDKIIQGDVKTATIGENARVGLVAVGDNITQTHVEQQVVITEETAYDVHGLPNPYLGLSAFTYADAKKYAGREKLIVETVAKITAPASPVALLFITGASGSGKSSFAQAGLMPALETFYDGFTVKHAVMRPAGDPLAALNDALWRQLRLSGPATGDLLPDTLSTTPTNQINLLVLDQFEEFFTQSPQTAREQFFAFLVDLPPFSQTRTHVIATMRADYLPELFNHSALYDIAKRGVDLRAMNVEELKQAIQQPLRASKYAAPEYGAKKFEPSLVERLAEDAAFDAAYLPLLQVTLEEIWRKGFLKSDAYKNLTDAIKQRADQVLEFRDFDDATPDEKRDPAEQAALLNLLLDLVDVSSDDDVHRDVRKQRAKLDLTRGDPQRERWLNQLSAARLLSVQQEGKDTNQIDASALLSTRVDLIHETLLTNWTRLQSAIAERRSELRHRARFEQNLDEWLSQNRAEQYLLEGVRLAEARELETHGDVALQNEDAKAYLRASIAKAEAQEKRRVRNLRLVAAALTILVLLAGVTAVYAFIKQRDADQRALEANQAADARATAEADAKAQAAVAQTAQVVAQARATDANNEKNKAIASANESRARLYLAEGNQVFDKNPLLGMRLGLEGLALTASQPNSQTLGITTEITKTLQQGKTVRLGSVANQFYTDKIGSVLVVASADAPGELWRTKDGVLLAQLAGKVGYDYGGVGYSPDAAASAFVVKYEDGSGELRWTKDGALLAGKVRAVDYSPDASVFVVRYLDAPGELRRTKDGALLAQLAGKVWYNNARVAYSPDAAASVFVVRYLDAPGELRRTKDGALLAQLAGRVADYGSVFYSPDAAASAFVVKYEDGSSELRRTKDGALLAQLAGKIWDIRYSPDANAVVVWYEDAPGELRRTKDGALLAQLAGKVAYNNGGVSYSPDANAVVVWYEAAPGELRRTKDGELRRTKDGALLAQLAGKVADNNGVAYSPDAAASVFVVRYLDAPGELWRTKDGALLAQLAGRVADNNGVSYSPDAAASVFVVKYEDGSGELRRTKDGVLLAGKVNSVDYSPDASVFVVEYQDALSELRRTSDGALLAQLAGKVWSNDYSPDASVFVAEYQDAPGELRRTKDGALLAQLAGKVAYAGNVSVAYSPDAAASAFVVRYLDAPGELRRTKDGALLAQLAGKVAYYASVFYSPDASVVVVKYDDAPSELRRTKDGALLAQLAGKVEYNNGRVGYSPDASAFVVRYADAPSELRRTKDGALLAQLAGRVADNNGVSYSPDAAASAFGHRFANGGDPSFLVRYDDAPGDLRRWSDGGLITKLTGKVSDKGIDYSPDKPSSAFVVRYDDVPWEVRRTSDGKVLAVLGLGVEQTIFEPTAQHLAVRYSDGRAYLLDLTFLNAYFSSDLEQPFSELSALACKYLFEPYHFDENELKKYMGDAQLQVCNTTEPLPTPTP